MAMLCTEAANEIASLTARLAESNRERNEANVRDTESRFAAGELFKIEAELRKAYADLTARLAAAESEVAGLRAALEGLLDEQNGVPLFTREKEYLAAVEAARTALRPAHTQTKST